MKTFKRIILTSVFTSCVIFTANSFALNYVDDAKQYMEKGEYKAAIIQLKNRLKENPEDAQARFLLGSSYLKTGNVKQADKEISRAYQLNPASEEIVLTYAQLLLLQRNYKKVDEILDEKLSDTDNEIQRQIYKAYVFLGQNQLADAKQIFSDLASQHENAQVYNGLANIAILEKEMDVATQWLEKSLKMEPENTDALQIKVGIEIANKNYAKALTIYNNLIQKQANNLSLYLYRAAIKMQLKDLQGAEKDIQKVLEKIKNQPQANYILAYIKLQEKNYKESQIAAQNVLNVLPQHYPSMLILGITNLVQGNFFQAEKYIIQYLSSNAENLNAQNILANIYLGQNKGEQAILVLEAIEEEQRNQSSTILTTLGSAYLLVGEHQKGLELLTRAKELSPEDQFIQSKLISGQLETGDFQNALKGLEQVAINEPENKKVNYLLIISYIQQGEIVKAKNRINELLNNDPQDVTLYGFQAAIAIINKNDELAKNSYQKALDINSNYIPAYLGLFKFSMQEKNYTQANNYVKKILDIDNKSVRAYVLQAGLAEITEKGNVEAILLNGLNNVKGDLDKELFLANFLFKWNADQKQANKSIAMAKEIERRYPEKVRALSFNVKVLLMNGKKEQAQKILLKILHNDPEDIEHRLLFAQLLNEEKEYISSIEVLDYVLSIKPDNKKALIIKTVQLQKSRQFAEALKVSKEFAQLYPESSIAEQLAGNIYIAQGQIDKAIDAYKIAFDKKPSNRYLLILTKMMIDKKQYKQAIELLDEAVKLNEKNIWAHLQLGDIYLKLENNELAIKHYEEVLKHQPKNIIVLNNLAWLYSLNRNPKAILLAKQAYEISPKAPSVIDTYGYIQIKQGDITEGIKLLEQAVNLAPKDYDIKYHLAEGYHLKGDNKKARALLNSLLNENTEFSEQENAKALFNQLQ